MKDFEAPVSLVVEDVETAPADLKRAMRFAYLEEAIQLRLRARRFRQMERVADAIAKFGGGSVLTSTIALAIGGQLGWPAILAGCVSLFFYFGGTMLAASAEYRATARDIAAERIAQALKETDDG